MSIYIARFRKTVTPLMHSCLWCPAKRCVFKFRLKRLDSTAWSRNESGSVFFAVGPDWVAWQPGTCQVGRLVLRPGGPPSQMLK